MIEHPEIYSQAQLMQLIQQVGFLPLLDSGISGYSAEEIVSDDCRYVVFPDGGWDWPLWRWKGPIVTEGDVVYGKFFDKKAGFISVKWLPAFANYRRDGYDFDARFEDGLATHNDQYLYNLIASKHSMLSKDAKILGGYMKPRNAGKDDWKPRKGFDTTITRLQMQCYIITSNFEYETGKNGQPYGWGIARYATPEAYLGKSFGKKVYYRTVDASRKRILKHLRSVLPDTETVYLERLIG